MNSIFKLTLFALILVNSSLAESGPRAWLIGHWKSNKELTVPTLRFASRVAPEKRARLESLLGKYEVCFADAEAVYHMPATEKKPPYGGAFHYRVLAETTDRLILSCSGGDDGKEDVTKIRFEGRNRCWVDVDTIKGVTGSQCFDPRWPHATARAGASREANAWRAG